MAVSDKSLRKWQQRAAWKRSRWAGRLPEATARERAAACLERASLFRWRAEAFRRCRFGVGRVPDLGGLPGINDGLSGVPWGRCDGQRHHDDHAAPRGGEVAMLGRAVALTTARFWIERARAWRAVADLDSRMGARRRGLGVPA